MAMTFSQPQYMGEIIASNIGGFAFKGNVDNKGLRSQYKMSKRTVYDKGVAKFGEGNDALYFYYEQGNREINRPTKMSFGGLDKIELIDVHLMLTEIYKISTDDGLTLYMIHDSYDMPEENTFILIGRRSDGRWVKYFDSDEIGKRYFNYKGWGLAFSNFKIAGSEITLNYKRNFSQKQIEWNRRSDEYGKFVFSWDKAKQWFAVRHVVN